MRIGLLILLMLEVAGPIILVCTKQAAHSCVIVVIPHEADWFLYLCFPFIPNLFYLLKLLILSLYFAVIDQKTEGCSCSGGNDQLKHEIDEFINGNLMFDRS